MVGRAWMRAGTLGLVAASCSPGAGDDAVREGAPTVAPNVATPASTKPPLEEEDARGPDLSNPDCLSYGAFRTGATSDGPVYPLPRFAPAVERRCVIAFRDNRRDLITILAEGERPEVTGKPVVFGLVPSAGGIRSSDGGAMAGEILITATTALGGQANADAMLADASWTKPVIGPDHSGITGAEWRSINITGALDRPALKAAIDSLEGRWAPLRDGTKGYDRFDAMNLAARWDRLSDGRHFLAEVGAPDLGTVRDKPRIANYVQLEKSGVRVVALVYHWESDFLSCYRGRLDERGRLTDAQFIDAGPDPGVRKTVKGLGTLWPDHLVNRPLRPASQRVRRDQKEGGWLVGRCRQLFAGEQDPPPTRL